MCQTQVIVNRPQGLLAGDDDDEQEGFLRFMEGKDMCDAFEAAESSSSDGDSDHSGILVKPRRRKRRKNLVPKAPAKAVEHGLDFTAKGRGLAKDSMLEFHRRYEKLKALNYQMVKRRVRADDPNLPTYTRIQPLSILNKSFMRLVRAELPTRGYLVRVPSTAVPYYRAIRGHTRR